MNTMKQIKFNSIILLLFFFFFISCDCKSPLESEESLFYGSNRIAIKNGTLIDGNGGTPLSNATVIINDGIITYVGLDETTIIPDSCYIIDAHGKSILPGFFNTHVHNTNDTTAMKTWLNEGVTTVRDLAIPSHERWLMQILVNSKPSHYFPRMIYSSPIFNIPTGVPHGSYGVIVSSVENARARTRSQINDGADLIKVYLDERDEYDSMPLEFLEAIVETAHSMNTRVVVHAQERHLYERAIDGGADEIVHPMIYEMTPDSLIERIIEDNIGVISTLEIYKNPPMRQQAMRNIYKLHQKGVRIALGSDYELRWSMELGMPITELELLHQAGLTTMETIITATKNAAYFCELEDSLGTIEEGKIADVILVDGNPLTNLRLLKDNLSVVIHNGEIINN